MSKPDNDWIDENARRVLDRAAASLDEATLRQLRAARERALAAAKAGPVAARRRSAGLWWPLGVGVAASVIAVVSAWLWFAGPADTARSLVAGIEDIELLAQKESPDFYADLEFYRWLDARRTTGS